MLTASSATQQAEMATFHFTCLPSEAAHNFARQNSTGILANIFFTRGGYWKNFCFPRFHFGTQAELPFLSLREFFIAGKLMSREENRSQRFASLSDLAFRLPRLH